MTLKILELALAVVAEDPHAMQRERRNTCDGPKGLKLETLDLSVPLVPRL